jgi:putative endonuclease
MMPRASLVLSFESLYTRLRAFADRRSPLPPHLLTGQRGEDAAYFRLRALGYTVVGRRWRSPRLPGDLDLVAWDGATLVFVEVKTRSAASSAEAFVTAEASVDAHKQDQLRLMASAYLRQIPEEHRGSVPIRFDVLSVYQLPGAPVRFEHLRHAFDASAPPRHSRRR